MIRKAFVSEEVADILATTWGEEKRVSRFDQDREDIIRVLYSILDYARFGYEISTCDNCNTCKRENCEYKPKVGQNVRWRCPLWKGEEG